MNQGIRWYDLSDRDDAPKVVGHYSHAVELANGSIFISGQKAWDRETGVLIDGDIVTQFRQIAENLERIFECLDIGWRNVARIQCFLENESDYSAFNEAYGRYLGAHRPVRAVLAGLDLRDGALVELVVDAYRNL